MSSANTSVIGDFENITEPSRDIWYDLTSNANENNLIYIVALYEWMNVYCQTIHFSEFTDLKINMDYFSGSAFTYTQT